MRKSAKQATGVASAVALAIGMLVAGVGAVPAQATKPGVVPIETVKGDFGSKTHFLYSESLTKDGKKIDAGLGDLITAENGTFTKTAKAAAVFQPVDPGHYRYSFGVSRGLSGTLTASSLTCTIKDRDTGRVLAENTVENSDRVTCDYTIPRP